MNSKARFRHEPREDGEGAGPQEERTPMIATERVTCEHEGTFMEGFARVPAGAGPHPAVLIIHGGNGIDHIVPRTAERLAEAGYLAIAADMVGPEAQKAGPQAVQKASAIYGQDAMLARRRTAAWVDVVAALPSTLPDRIAVIGYCFGGHCVLELARSGADVRAVVSFHGIPTTRAPAQSGSVKAEVAVYTGAKDPFAPVDQVDALRRELSDAGASYHITVFGEAEHAFTDPDIAAYNQKGCTYNAVADRVSWAGMMALLQLTLRG